MQTDLQIITHFCNIYNPHACHKNPISHINPFGKAHIQKNECLHCLEKDWGKISVYIVWTFRL